MDLPKGTAMSGFLSSRLNWSVSNVAGVDKRVCAHTTGSWSMTTNATTNTCAYPRTNQQNDESNPNPTAKQHRVKGKKTGKGITLTLI